MTNPSARQTEFPAKLYGLRGRVALEEASAKAVLYLPDSDQTAHVCFDHIDVGALTVRKTSGHSRAELSCFPTSRCRKDGAYEARLDASKGTGSIPSV